jgi:hypothetical protein
VKKFQFHCCVWPAAIVNPRSIRQCTGIVVSFSMTHRRSLRRFSFTGHLRPPAGKLQNFRLNLTQNLASIGRSHTRIIRNCHANANSRELDAIGHSALAALACAFTGLPAKAASVSTSRRATRCFAVQTVFAVRGDSNGKMTNPPRYIVTPSRVTSSLGFGED